MPDEKPLTPAQELDIMRQTIYETISDEYGDDCLVIRQGKRIVITLKTGMTIVVLVSEGK